MLLEGTNNVKFSALDIVKTLEMLNNQNSNLTDEIERMWI